ncbi:hypothetical protein GUJ93_ZPchr0006g43261 [Zizania palustris]|uniref:J domain-containing protein n=1 Tax=Zizania palustris TaxID=103762 RepID=A0A8J5T2S0_ZIZPA|nr:hypothetical protein GUJ93_ZPchr0006g43261 [Zizania palustris]
MAAAGDCSRRQHDADSDLYAVLGLRKECTDAELRVAYRKLAMIWHPDRCSAAGSSTRVEDAKERFQEIQGAYSVLSDSNKRLLYDVGVYDGEADEDDLSGMGDFLGEMVQMMSQAAPTESFEELQHLFVDMFQADIDAGLYGGDAAMACTLETPPSSPPPAATSTNAQAPASPKDVNKRCSPEMDSGASRGLQGSESTQRRPPWTSHDGSTTNGGGKRRQRPPASHNVSSDAHP